MTTTLLNEIEKLLNKDFVTSTSSYTCPLDGDANNCQCCIYNSDYFYFDGECMSRDASNSKWGQILIQDEEYSGTNDEIKIIPIIGLSSPGQPKNKGNTIAIIWHDLSKKHTIGINYNDIEAKSDIYALSCILEVLREELSLKDSSNNL